MANFSSMTTQMCLSNFTMSTITFILLGDVFYKLVVLFYTSNSLRLSLLYEKGLIFIFINYIMNLHGFNKSNGCIVDSESLLIDDLQRALKRQCLSIKTYITFM